VSDMSNLIQEPKLTEEQLLQRLQSLSNYRISYNVMINTSIDKTDLRIVAWALIKIMRALDLITDEGVLSE